MIASTKTTARQTNHQAHILQRWAAVTNEFNQTYLNPYLNFHRPCFLPEFRTQRGKARKGYGDETRTTPYDKLKSLSPATTQLNPGACFVILGATRQQSSANQTKGLLLQKVLHQLFTSIHARTQHTGWQTPHLLGVQPHSRIEKYSAWPRYHNCIGEPLFEI